MPLGSSSAAPVINPGPSFFSSGTWLRSFSFSRPWPLEEVHLRRPEEADQAKREADHAERAGEPDQGRYAGDDRDRKSTRLNSSHGYISYAVFCLKKKKIRPDHAANARDRHSRHLRHHRDVDE